MNVWSSEHRLGSPGGHRQIRNSAAGAKAISAARTFNWPARKPHCHHLAAMPGSQMFGQFLNVKSVEQADPGECRTLFSACFQAQCVLSGESSTCKERMDWTQAQHSSCAPAQISIVYRSLTANSCFVFLLQEHVFGSHENACNLAYSKVQALNGTGWHWLCLWWFQLGS